MSLEYVRSSSGSEFQNVGPATGKARRLNVVRRHHGTSIEADVWWQISNAVDLQSQRPVRNSSPRTAAPYAEGIGRQSERAYTKPATIRPTNASNASSASILVSLSALTLLQFTSTFFSVLNPASV